MSKTTGVYVARLFSQSKEYGLWVRRTKEGGEKVVRDKLVNMIEPLCKRDRRPFDPAIMSTDELLGYYSDLTGVMTDASILLEELK